MSSEHNEKVVLPKKALTESWNKSKIYCLLSEVKEYKLGGQINNGTVSLSK